MKKLANALVMSIVAISVSTAVMAAQKAPAVVG